MKLRSLPLLNYLLGFALVVLVASTCFSTRSSSSSPPSTRNGLEATATTAASRLGGVKSEPTLAFPASPFAPTITATKSHAPAGNANPGDTLTYTTVIANSGTSDATGVSFSDTVDPNTTLVGGSVKASPLANADSYHTIGNVNISVPVGQGVIANDSNPNGSGTLAVTQVNATPVPGGGSATASTANGSVTMSSDGSFTYTPNVNFRGPSDSFTYTLDNGTGLTDTATVTIAINGLIWFVDSNAATNGDGRLNSPYNCLVGAGCYSSAASQANDTIFVYSGSYTGGLTLLNGQKFIGQGAGDTLLNITGYAAPSGTNLLPATGGANPTISAAGADLTLASGNTVRGVTLNGTAGAAVALTGSGFGTAVIGETALGGTGQALNLSTGTLSGPVASTASFTSISSTNSSATGISLSGVSGAMSSATTTVANPSGIGIGVNGSSAALNFGPTSATSSGGTGVSLTSNTGTITFGALTITPDANQRGLLATDNTQTITTAGGSVSTSGAIAVEITRAVGTTPLAVSLTSVSASGGSNGIKLSNTSGSFTVTGDGGGASNGSGGTISGTTAEGILINTASNVSLGYMNITNPGTNGIRGTGINGFTLNRSAITDSAGNTSTDDGVGLSNTSGALAITNSSISGARHQGITVDNLNTNLASLTLQATSVTATAGGDGVLIQMRGTSVLTTGTIGGASASLGNTLSNNSSTGLQVSNADTANIANLTVQNNTVNGNNAGMDFDLSQAASMTIHVLNNTLTNHSSQVINLFSGGGNTGGSMTATVQSNTIGTAGVLDSGSAFGNGIRVFLQNATAGAITIDGNQIREVPNGSGIDVEAIGHTASNTVKLKISNNTLPRPTGTNQNVCGTGNFPCPLSTVFVLSDTDGPVETVCASITGNSAYDPNSWPDGAGWSAYYLAARSGAVLRIEGNTSQTPQQVILNNNTVTNLTAPGYGEFTDESGNVVVVSPGTCGTFPMSVAPEFAIESKGAADAPDDALLIGGIERPGQKPVSALSQQELNWMVQAALARWQQAGVGGEDLARLNQVSFEIAQLGNGQLASRNGLAVRLDEKAAGFGWYFDPQPSDDSEYDVAVTGKERQASETSAAFGRMDLLTVVMRELGSVYLQNQKRVPKTLRVMMESTLAPSVRRVPVFNATERSTSSVTPGASQPIPGAVQAATESLSNRAYGLTRLRPAVFNLNAEPASYATRARHVAALSPAPYSGETVNLSIGTLPAGKSVTIIFQVTVDNPLPAGVCSITNVGHITGSNFSPVDTNSDVANVTKPLTLSACPSNITRNTDAGVCTAVVTYTAPTADGCPAPTVTCTPASGTAFNKGTTTVTCTASNGVSADASCTFTVTVNDNEAPAITCPANMNQSTDPNVCTAVVTYATPTATDNCPGVGAVTCSPASGMAFNKGTTTVTCSVTDASSNPASCSFTVTVNDTQAPTINCPANITHGTDPDVCKAVVTYATPTVSDNCPGVGSPSCSPASGSTFPKGATTVTCSVTDASGNPASCSFTVTVNDTQAPTIGACPSNISVVSGGACQTVTYTPPTATDNCGTATVTCAPPSGFCFPNGTTTVTCTATDTSPDSPDSSCSFTVTVVPCTITCPANINVGTNPSQQCGTVVNYPAPSTSGGGCGTVTCSPASGAFFPVGTTMVTCSTQAGPSCGFSVTVFDNTPPVLTCAPDQTVLAGTGCQAQVPNFVVSASDNCGGVTVTQAPAPGTIVGPGMYAIHVSVTDGAGNMTTCDKTFTVTNDPPVVVNVTGPSGPIALGTSASVTASYTDTAVQGHTATFSWGDASANTTVSLSPANSGNVTASHTYAATGVYTVTVTVTDDCGAASAAFAYRFIVVYDANGGFVTGGGWIQSAAGSYVANPSLTGKANFGFVVKYHNGAAIPTGNTEFKFDSMNFKASAFEWLVVSGAKAQFKGSGTINGAGDYRFLVTVTDGNQPGGGGTDKFRIKIWDASTNAVIYDNVIGAPDDINLANPQALGGGSIVIH